MDTQLSGKTKRSPRNNYRGKTFLEKTQGPLSFFLSFLYLTNLVQFTIAGGYVAGNCIIRTCVSGKMSIFSQKCIIIINIV